MEQALIKLKNGISDYKKDFPDAVVVDTYEEQIKELFLIRHPQFRFNPNYQEPLEEFLKEHLSGKTYQEVGEWFYFPWNKKLVHYLAEDLHLELRTARNKNLITKEEQEKFYNFCVGFAGLSVGSHAALTVAMMGGAKYVKLADPDEISGSNLNRIRYDYTQVGENKAELAAHVIWQINPYAEITLFTSGISDENMENFFIGNKKIDCLVEGCDNLEMKIKLRIEAKKHKLPVVMGTDNGDNIIFDVERFDLNPEAEIFNGVVGDLTVEEFRQMSPADLPKMATKLAGADFVVNRMLESIFEVGKTLYSWPQLGDAATLCGAATAYVLRRIALDLPVKIGKMEVNLDAVFDPEYNSEEAITKRNNQKKELLNKIGFNGK